MRKLLRNKKGVTLIELLAVLVILGIIAAIAVPTIGGLIENQREKAAEAEWTNIQESARLYASSEEPDANFSLQDMIDADYINFDPADSTFTDDAVGTTDLTAITIFDENGDVDAATEWTTDQIYIDGYQVYGTVV